MTLQYVAPVTASKLFFNPGNTFYVALTGSDTNGNDGSVDRPFRTLQFAVTTAASGDCILMGPGTFAEAVVINKSLYISALVPGATVLDFATAVASSLTVTGTVANQVVVWEGIDIANTNNAATTSVALTINNTGGVAGTYVFKNCRITGGSTTANAATAVSFTGAAGNATRVYIQSPRIVGCHLLTAAHASDVVSYSNCEFVCGPAIWMRITGTSAGNFYIHSSILRGTTGTEYIEYGNAAATTAILTLISSRLNCYLRMNSTAAANLVNINDSSVTYTTSNQLNQRVIYYNGDYLKIVMMNLDLDPGAPAAVTMYTVPAGRRFNPERAVTTNRGAASGAAFNYRYNGTGAGSVVGAIGVGALAAGSTVNTVLQDSIAAAGTLQFDVVAASTTDADRGEASVMGRLT